MLIDKAEICVGKARERLTPKMNAFIKSATIITDLRENLPDRLGIVTTFSFTFTHNQITFQKSIMVCFYVECLSIDFEKQVEEKFLFNCQTFIKEFCHLLYGLANEIHTTLQEIPQ
jgi:hypothetical protein